MTLGMVGVHGVMSLVAARRSKEIGIRVVLGARRAELLRMLLAGGVRLTLAGAALGVAGGVAQPGNCLQASCMASIRLTP